MREKGKERRMLFMCTVAGGSSLYAAATDPFVAAGGTPGGGRIGPIVSAATHSYHPYRRWDWPLPSQGTLVWAPRHIVEATRVTIRWSGKCREIPSDSSQNYQKLENCRGRNEVVGGKWFAVDSVHETTPEFSGRVVGYYYFWWCLFGRLCCTVWLL